MSRRIKSNPWTALITGIASASLLAATTAATASAQSPAGNNSNLSKIQSLESFISKNSIAETNAWFESVYRDPAIKPEQREALLYAGALALAQLQQPSTQLKQIVESLTLVAPISMTTITEGRHTAKVPTYDVASAARVTQRRWRETEASRDVLTRLSQGQSPIPAWVGDPERDRDLASGVRIALASLPDSELGALSNAVRDGYAQQPLLAGSMRDIAVRRGDGDLLVLLAQTAPSRDALDLLRLSADDVDDSQMLRICDAMRERDELASAAILGLGKLVDRQPVATETLFELLDDEKHGGSAASALARYGSGLDMMRLSDVVSSEPESVTADRALLALRLSENPAAHDQLGRLANDSRLNEETRAKVSQWLQQ